MSSDDYTPVIIIYPNGNTRRGNCKRSGAHTVETALDRLHNDYAAYVLDQDAADQVLSRMHRREVVA